jgi:hypothetical protein
MQVHAILKALPVICAGVLCAACADTDQATAPDAGAVGTRAASAQTAQLVVGMLPEAFTARASMDPYLINQNPEIMLHSKVVADIAIQRLVTAPGGGGPWHTHPGPSFAIVEDGAVMITRYDRRTGCTSTVYGPGQAAGRTYYEVAGEVHKATVVSAVYAVEYKVRFNVPAGEPFGTPEDSDPVC